MTNRKYLDIFLREAEEHLSALQRGLLVLEKEHDNRELIHGLLRNAHTLKGSARMLGFDSISAIAHRMEDLVKEVEDGVCSVDARVVDRLLRGTDAISLLTAAMESGEEAAFDVETFLRAFESGDFSAFAPEPVPAQVQAEERDTVRTKVETLDTLINLVGEMLISRGRFGEKVALLRSLCATSAESVPVAAVTEFARDLEQEVLSLSALIEDVHGQAMTLRMLPLHTVTHGLERMVRDVSQSLGKQVTFTTSGEEIELDRVLLDMLKPAFIHVVTNAVDHGVETPAERVAAGKPAEGRVAIQARYEGSRVRVDISDDGEGIDPARMRQTAVSRGIVTAAEAALLADEETLSLLFRPGFSTRDTVTGLSGRGVGMDVVRTSVEKVKGQVAIDSRVGEGTTVSLFLPLTLTVIGALLVECAGEVVAVPLANVEELTWVRREDVGAADGRQSITLRDAPMPLVSLAGLLGFADEDPRVAEKLLVLVLKHRDARLACSIDRSMGSMDIVVKGLGEQFKVVQCVSGATILGDGSPALILHVPDLFAVAEGEQAAAHRVTFSEPQAPGTRGTILVVDDSITTRTMERGILVAHGYSVDLAVSGEDAIGKVAEKRYDLVVSDIEMPGINGFELTKQLRDMEDYREVPVIIVSSRSRDEDKRQALVAGAQAYIVKGTFDQDELVHAVEALIG